MQSKPATPDVIGPASMVTLHFSVALRDGTVVDSTFGGQPASFNMGDGSLLPGFERKLIGLTAGQKKSFVIAPEEGFGMPNPNNVQEFRREQFAADLQLEEGLVVSFADAARAELPGVVKRVERDRVIVDFNHPLAGREIVFEVDIVTVANVVDTVVGENRGGNAG